MQKKLQDDLAQKLNTVGCGEKCRHRTAVLKIMKEREAKGDLSTYFEGRAPLDQAVRMIVSLYVAGKFGVQEMRVSFGRTFRFRVPNGAHIEEEIELAVSRLLDEDIEDELTPEVLVTMGMSSPDDMGFLFVGPEGGLIGLLIGSGATPVFGTRQKKDAH